MQLDLFAPLPVRASGMLALDALHSMYWEEAGNPEGQPVVVLHGGPGAGSSPSWRQFFDPTHYRIVQFDQRGCGRSLPAGELRANTMSHLVADIDALRRHLGVTRWLVFGGSWGATLALAYGQAYPQHCLGFILRSIFLGSRDELAWYFESARRHYPELFARLTGLLPPEERADPLGAYARRLARDDRTDTQDHAQAWMDFECGRASIAGEASPAPDEFAWVLARLETWYFSQGCFLEPDALLSNMRRLAGLPALIVHGRLDMLCAPLAAFQAAGHYPGAVLRIVPDGGHTAFDPAMRTALLEATEAFRRSGRFD